jgi:hypothetical protein
MDHQEESGLPLDGNAASGLLSELFALNVTVAQVTCNCCGAIGQVGETRVYVGSWEPYFAAPDAIALSCDWSAHQSESGSTCAALVVCSLHRWRDKILLHQSLVRDFKIVLGAGNFSPTKGFLDRIECNLSLPIALTRDVKTCP